jgi:hypothetical protein
MGEVILRDGDDVFYCGGGVTEVRLDRETADGVLGGELLADLLG